MNAFNNLKTGVKLIGSFLIQPTNPLERNYSPVSQPPPEPNQDRR
jgi:hypothetical protein